MNNKFEINTQVTQPGPGQDREKHSALEPFFRFIWDLSKVLLLALVIIIPIRYFLFQPFIVAGSSMEPNFHNGDYLIIDEISYRFGQPERGDVVVLRFPNDPTQFFIKRIVGLPGERVIISGGRVQILAPDSTRIESLEEEYLPPGSVTAGNLSYTLEEGEYFVLGDNRDASSDSRAWGKLDRNDIVGRAWVKLFPLNSLSVVPDVEYNLP